MGFLIQSPKTNAQASPQYTQMQVQSSAYGLAIPIVYGTTRVGCNLGWYANFVATQGNSGGSGGGGGKGGAFGGGCFPAGVMVSTPRGDVAIEALRRGDEVWAFDEAGQYHRARVVETHVHDDHPTCSILYEGGRLPITPNHWVLTEGGAFREVAELGAGSIIYDGAGEARKIIGIESGTNATVYNLTVEPHHTFVAGGVRVHNGGGGKTGSGATTYSADVISLLCEGPIAGIPNSWTSQTLNVGIPDFDLFTGAYEQAGWPYLQDTNPAQYSNYSGIAYVAAASYPMGNSANLPNLNFEVQGFLQATAPGQYGGNGCVAGGDADPSLVAPDLLTNSHYGIGFPSNRIGQVTNNNEAHVVPASGPYTVTVNNSTGALIVSAGNTDGYDNTISLASTAGIISNMPASGPGVPPGAYVTGIVGNIIYLSANTTGANTGGSYSFSGSGGFLYNINVVDTIVNGVGTNLYTCFLGAPGNLQYSYNSTTGVYAFNSAQAGVTVNIRYASLGALSTFQAWAMAAGLWISPAYTDQGQASSLIDDIATATYSDWVWSSGVLTLIPRSAVAVSGNGFTYTPTAGVLFALGIDDFMANMSPTGTISAAANDDPVIVTRLRKSDQMNDVKIEFLDRANNYAPSIAQATDQSLIDRFGRRASSPKSLHMFCDGNAANLSAQLQLQDQYIRNTYSIQLDVRYCVLDPMDIVSLTDPDYSGLTNIPVRLLEITENDDGTLSMNAEEYPGNIGSCPSYSLNVGSGHIQNFNAAPGSVNTPLLFGMPPILADNQGLSIGAAISGSDPANFGGCECWVASDEGGPYRQLTPNQVGASRMGLTTGDFPVGPDPDTTDTLAVNLAESAGQLQSGTQADADNANTLVLVRGVNGDEYISYETATLTSANNYNLGTYIRRGQYSTVIVDHPTGSSVARIDSGIYQIPYQASQIGQTLFFKFPAFNIYGGGGENIADIAAYPITLTPPPPPPNVQGFSAQQNGNVVVFTWDAVAYAPLALAGYYVGYVAYPGAGSPTPPWSRFTLLTEASAGTEMTNAEVPPGTWLFGIRAANVANTPQNGLGLSPMVALANGGQPLTVVNLNDTISTAIQEPTWFGSKANFAQHEGVLIPAGTKPVSSYAMLAPPPVPVTSAVAGSLALSLTYYVMTTYLSSVGETMGSVEAVQAVLPGFVLQIASPAAVAGAIGWNAYVGTSSGTETLQNSTPNAIGSPWTQSVADISGAPLPSRNSTGQEPFDVFVPDVTPFAYYIAPTIDTGYNDELRVYDTQGLATGTLQIGGNPNQDAMMEIDFWLSAGTDPNSFIPWMIGFETFRYLRAMLYYAPVPGRVGYVYDFTPTIDTAPVVESAGSVIVAPGGTAITFPTQFHQPPYMPAPNVLSPTGAAYYSTAINVTNTGFTAHVWNGTGADVGGTISWVATGE